MGLAHLRKPKPPPLLPSHSLSSQVPIPSRHPHTSAPLAVAAARRRHATSWPSPPHASLTRIPESSRCSPSPAHLRGLAFALGAAARRGRWPVAGALADSALSRLASPPLILLRLSGDTAPQKKKKRRLADHDEERTSRIHSKNYISNDVDEENCLGSSVLNSRLRHLAVSLLGQIVTL